MEWSESFPCIEKWNKNILLSYFINYLNTYFKIITLLDSKNFYYLVIIRLRYNYTFVNWKAICSCKKHTIMKNNTNTNESSNKKDEKYKDA
jgi:hypothetical protein